MTLSHHNDSLAQHDRMRMEGGAERHSNSEYATHSATANRPKRHIYDHVSTPGWLWRFQRYCDREPSEVESQRARNSA